jgi:hypothetical protein
VTVSVASVYCLLYNAYVRCCYFNKWIEFDCSDVFSARARPRRGRPTKQVKSPSVVDSDSSAEENTYIFILFHADTFCVLTIFCDSVSKTIPKKRAKGRSPSSESSVIH